METGINCKVILDDVDLSRWVKNIAIRQLPFATSLAMNRTSSKLGKIFARKAKSKFKVDPSNNWASRFQQLKFGAIPKNIPAGWYSIPSKKGSDLSKLTAEVGESKSLIAQQFQNKTITRTTQDINSNYLAIPCSVNRHEKGTGRKKGVITAKILLRSKRKYRVFIKPLKGINNANIIFKREDSRKITPQYILTNRQNIKSLFNFEGIVKDKFKNLFDNEFIKAMEYAIRTYKPKKGLL